MKRGRPPVNKPKQVRLSAYVDADIAQTIFELADIQNQSVSEYLGDLILTHLGRIPENELKARYC